MSVNLKRLKVFCTLTAIIIPTTAFGWSSKGGRVYNDIQSLDAAIKVFHMENDKYPTPENFLSELLSSGMISDIDRFQNDAWGNPYVYKQPGQHGIYDIYSLGQNGIDDGGSLDDISNWANVNDRFYWKANWPQGRLCMITGILIGVAFLLLGIVLPWRVVIPLSIVILSVGLSLGLRLLMHPGIVPSRNGPLALGMSLVAVVFIGSIIFLVATIRSQGITKRRSERLTRP